MNGAFLSKVSSMLSFYFDLSYLLDFSYFEKNTFFEWECTRKLVIIFLE